MVLHISTSYWIGYNGRNNLPILVMAQNYRNHQEGSQKSRNLTTYKTANKKYGELPDKIAKETPWKNCLYI